MLVLVIVGWIMSDNGASFGTGSSPTGQAATRLDASRFDPSRMTLAPRPNFTTKATFADMIEWAQAVEEGRWSWVRNSACKYVTLRIDTRAGVYRIEDRDGNEISLADFRRQFGRE